MTHSLPNLLLILFSLLEFHTLLIDKNETFAMQFFPSVNLEYFRINLFIYRTYKVSLCFYLPSVVLSFLPTFLSLLQWRLHSLYIDLLQGNTFSQKNLNQKLISKTKSHNFIFVIFPTCHQNSSGDLQTCCLTVTFSQF